MAEYSANAVQTIAPGEVAVFTATSVPCRREFVRHRDDTGNFLLSGWVPPRYSCCPCQRDNSADYLVDFGANIAVPTGGTVGAISVAIAVDGTTIPSSTMIVTPAAVEEYFNISTNIDVPIWRGCCQTVTVRNTSDQPILMQNANIRFTRPDLNVTR